jgi:hypothetical protein
MHFQTNVILTHEDADWLDQQALAFRKNNRKSLSRSALLRALIQGARIIKLDVSRCRSEEQIAHDVAYLLRCATRLVEDEGRNTPAPQNDIQR